LSWLLSVAALPSDKEENDKKEQGAIEITNSKVVVPATAAAAPVDNNSHAYDASNAVQVLDH
jgi:hypothetical protein